MNSLFDTNFLQNNMMGPNALMMLKELTESLQLKKGMRVLDLGCGKGLTSIYLAQRFDVQVFAVDLWIPATENFERFKKFDLEDKIIPIHADATALPFADDYFDAVISIDAYHYFGSNAEYFDKHLARLLKSDAQIGLGIPGMKVEFDGQIPEEMKPFWPQEVTDTIRSEEWWKKILGESEHFELVRMQEMSCSEQAWQEWLMCDNEHAIGDREMMKVDDGRYMNVISIVGKKKS